MLQLTLFPNSGELRTSKLFSPAQLNTRSIKDEMRAT